MSDLELFLVVVPRASRKGEGQDRLPVQLCLGAVVVKILVDVATRQFLFDSTFERRPRTGRLLV